MQNSVSLHTHTHPPSLVIFDKPFFYPKKKMAEHKYPYAIYAPLSGNFWTLHKMTFHSKQTLNEFTHSYAKHVLILFQKVPGTPLLYIETKPSMPNFKYFFVISLLVNHQNWNYSHLVYRLETGHLLILCCKYISYIHTLAFIHVKVCHDHTLV